MERIARVLMNLIQSEIKGCAPDVSEFMALSPEDVKKLYTLSQKHSVTQLVGSALGKDKTLSDCKLAKPFIRQVFSAVYQYEKMNAEIRSICLTFDAEKIPYIKLKGARIRSYYPEPWLRTSCDIDVLVHEKDLNAAVAVLAQKLHYKIGRKGYHDVSLHSPSGIHLELHYNLDVSDIKFDAVLKRSWDLSYPIDVGGASAEYKQTNEFFIFHILAHAANHFLNGGCGIRPFMDIFLLRSKMEYDESQVQALCKSGGIEKFYKNVVNLIEVWFSAGGHTDLTAKMEEYILAGGIYGNLENLVAVRKNKRGSTLKYLWSRIFPSYQTLKTIYPILGKHKWLIPLFHIHRWLCILFGKRLKKGAAELKTSLDMASEHSRTVNKMLQELGLL